MTINSAGTPSGYSSTTCNYCSVPGEEPETESNYRTACLDAVKLSCGVYQKMIDRGWRRSGKWCYKPDLQASCCPQYTIRLDAIAFKPSKSQRKLVNRWNRYVTGSSKEGKEIKADGKVSKAAPAFCLSTSIHACEAGFYHEEKSIMHQFQTTLEYASYTNEKYALYEKYQRTVHKDDESSPRVFKRFLVDSPLHARPIPYVKPPPSHLPTQYGSYHQLYRLDGQLIAIGVLDILPGCVSSVYFIYDNDWDEFSLGKLSALREASLAREIHDAGAPQMGFLYMGFYIHSCQKMRYKGEYSPSYLADPETYDWFPLSTCLPLLDKYRYACFQNPSNSMSHLPEIDEVDISSKNGTISGLDESDLSKIQLVIDVVKGEIRTVPMNMTPYWTFQYFRGNVMECVRGLGMDISKEIGFLYYT